MEVDEVDRLRRMVSRIARELNASATAEGLTPTQASVLGVIAGRGPLSLTEIAAIERLNPTMLSRVVGKLEVAGLITRQPDPADLRTVTAHITVQGRRTHARVKQQRVAAVAGRVARLTATEQAQLVAALPALEALAEQLRRGDEDA